MVHNIPRIRWLAPTSDALLGFALPVLPSQKMTSPAMQMRLLDRLWKSEVNAFFLRLITSASHSGVTIFLLCRISPLKRLVLTHDDCIVMAQRVQQLFKECGYTLVPITDDATFDLALQPFVAHELAEIRRDEELFKLQDAYTQFEMYTVHPWEWMSTQPLHFWQTLSQKRNQYLVSISLMPTRLSNKEENMLEHISSSQVRDLLKAGGAKGKRISTIYTMFAQKLQQPFLLRICLAATDRAALTTLGQTLLGDSATGRSDPILQWPGNASEWQAIQRHLFALEWAPWGNIRDYEPTTARLRYLVDSKGASMGFHLPIAPDPATSRTQKIRVLLVFADPHNQEFVLPGRHQRPLWLGTEDRIIHEAIKLSRYRDNIELKVLHAATIHDLSRALLEDEYHLVHIASHGARDGSGLILEDEIGRPRVVPQQALADLFGAYNTTLRCVVLNACYGLAQGELIALGVNTTIAMENEIDDESAREFARGFYDALGAGKESDFAYAEGCRRARLVVSGVAFAPKLLKKTGLY